MPRARAGGEPERLPDLPADRGAPPGAGDGGDSWGGVVAAFLRVVAQAAGAPGGAKSVDAVVDLLHALHRVQDDQAAMLRSIQEDVELLRTAAYNSAQLLVSEAARVGPADDHYATYLDQATLSLFQALASCSSLEEQAVVQFHLGVAYLLLERRADAQHWLLQSCTTGRQVLEDLTSRADDTHVIHHKATAGLAALASIAAAPVALPADIALLMKKHRKRALSKDAASALERLVPSVNASIACLNALGAAPPVPLLAVRRSHRELVLEQQKP